MYDSRRVAKQRCNKAIRERLGLLLVSLALYARLPFCSSFFVHDFFPHPWPAINAEKTELELTGGPLSDLFDRFFRYVPRATLFAGAKYGEKFADVETFFTRGTRDPVEVDGLSGAADVLPDGRFVVRATANADEQRRKREFSLVRG